MNGRDEIINRVLELNTLSLIKACAECCDRWMKVCVVCKTQEEASRAFHLAHRYIIDNHREHFYSAVMYPSHKLTLRNDSKIYFACESDGGCRGKRFHLLLHNQYVSNEVLWRTFYHGLIPQDNTETMEDKND